MKNQRGITLIALMTTVVIIIILASVGIKVGMDTYETGKITTFISQMQLIQKKVDTIVNSGLEQEILENTNILTDEQKSILASAYNNGEIISDDSSNTYNNCRYFSSADLKTYLELENINDDIIINFATREIISLNGIEYNGKTYYTQYKLPSGQAVIQQNTTDSNRTLNSVTVVKNMDGLNATITIIGISITNGTLSYKETNDSYWTNITNYTTENLYETITISNSGTYIFKLVDNTNNTNSSVSEGFTITTTNGPKENENITANKTNGGINEYDYAELNWVEGTATVDSSTYIWVPRFAYLREGEEGSYTYTIKYLKGTTNVTTDDTYLDTTYTIPDKFTDGNGNKLTGIWLKYPSQITTIEQLITSIQNASASDVITVI